MEVERDVGGKAQPRPSSARGRNNLSTVATAERTEDASDKDVESDSQEQHSLSQKAMLAEAARETEALFASLGVPLQLSPQSALRTDTSTR